MENDVFLSVDVWELIIDYTVKHPFSVVRFDDTYYRYNPNENYIEYRKPFNKKLNGWYCARGLFHRAYIYGYDFRRPT